MILSSSASNVFLPLMNYWTYTTLFGANNSSSKNTMVNFLNTFWFKMHQNWGQYDNFQFVPQNALIKFVRNAPLILRWFQSDSSQENMDMLQLEQPSILQWWLAGNHIINYIKVYYLYLLLTKNIDQKWKAIKPIITNQLPLVSTFDFKKWAFMFNAAR